MSAAESLPVGALLQSFHGAEWRKRADGSFDVLSDPEWGPVWADDIPSGVVLVNWAKFAITTTPTSHDPAVVVAGDDNERLDG